MIEDSDGRTNRCSGILRKGMRWKQSGGKEGAFFVSTNSRCDECDSEDECVKSTFKEAFPSQDYNNVAIYVNLKPKSEVVEQKPQIEKADEISEEETPAPTV